MSWDAVGSVFDKSAPDFVIRVGGTGSKPNLFWSSAVDFGSIFGLLNKRETAIYIYIYENVRNRAYSILSYKNIKLRWAQKLTLQGGSGAIWSCMGPARPARLGSALGSARLSFASQSGRLAWTRWQFVKKVAFRVDETTIDVGNYGGRKS